MKNPVISRLSRPLKSLVFNRCRGLGGDVVEHSVDMGHLVHNPDADAVQDLVGNPGPVRRHEVAGGDAPQGQGVIVGPAVPHI